MLKTFFKIKIGILKLRLSITETRSVIALTSSYSPWQKEKIAEMEEKLGKEKFEFLNKSRQNEYSFFLEKEKFLKRKIELLEELLATQA